MNKIISFLLFSTSIYASHSIDFGAFYTSHHEKGYSYDLGGISLKYEIGNSKGLKAGGKVRVSYDSDLLFVQTSSEILYYVPLNSLEIIPFFGAKTLSHEVYKEKGVIGAVNKAWIPCGIGATATFGKIAPQLRFAYLIPITNTFIENDLGELYGRESALKPMYWIEAKCEYKFSDTFAVGISAEFEQDFHQRMRTLAGDANFSLKF